MVSALTDWNDMKVICGHFHHAFSRRKKLIFCFTLNVVGLHTHFLQEQKVAAARHDRFTSKTSKMHCWIFFLPTEGSNYKFLQNSVSKITFYVLICNRDRSLGCTWHDLRYERSRTLRHSNSMKKNGRSSEARRPKNVENHRHYPTLANRWMILDHCW